MAQSPSSNEEPELLFLNLNSSLQEINIAIEQVGVRGDEPILVLPKKTNTEADHGVIRNLLPEIEQVLKNNEAYQRKITTLIISGHSTGNGYADGSSGELDYHQFEEFVEAHPELKNSVRSLILLTCYSGLYFRVNRWVTLFPNLQFLAGYPDKGFSNTQRPGLLYLKALLINEKRFLSAKNLKEIESIHTEMRLENPTLKPALYVFTPQLRVPYFSNVHFRQGAFSPWGQDECTRRISDLELNQTELTQFMNGEKPIAAHEAELKTLYAYYQNNYDCIAAQIGDHFAEAKIRDIHMLLSYDTLQMNFKNNNAQVIALAVDELKSLPEDHSSLILAAKNIHQMDRKSIYQFSTALNDVATAHAEKKNIYALAYQVLNTLVVFNITQ